MENWYMKNKQADFGTIAKSFGISEVMARLIINRDITSAKELTAYLNPDLRNLHSPSMLKDMDTACMILSEKIEQGKLVRIVGDYDVDGVMATYILYTSLLKCGAKVDYTIPERIKDGYGINLSIIEQAFKDNVDTILTCDNGIAALEQIQYAKELGMTVIVTDHHDIPFAVEENDKKEIIVPADAVVNPKQQACLYPFKGICGALVAYKLANHLYEHFFGTNEEILDLLEFAAIATVCDVMDLVDENRIIVRKGLEKIGVTNNLGLRALIKATGLEDKQIGVYHLGFIIGPCINASGRLESAQIALKLFLCKDEKEANQLADYLKTLNEERKELTNEGLLQAIEIIETSSLIDDKVLVVYLPDCHESLAGIIAGRLKERYNKPAIVLTKAEQGAKGSARSIEAYNMFEELSACKEILTKFGGHPMAAGLSLEEEKIEMLRDALNKKTRLTEEDLRRKVSFDMVLPLDMADLPLINELSRLEPFGKGNVKPLFAIRDVNVQKATVLGANRNVLRLTVRQMNSSERKPYTAMVFQNVEAFFELVTKKYGATAVDDLLNGTANGILMDFVYYPDINEYNGYQNIQIIVQNYR